MFRIVFLVVCFATPAFAQGSKVPRHQCFPIEALHAESREKAERLMIRMLDSEALYTVAGGLKPISEGFWQTRFPETETTTPEIEQVREILGATVSCGVELTAGVHIFVKSFDGKKNAAAFVAHRASLQRMITRHPLVFEPLGITPLMEAGQVIERVDRGPSSLRWRAFGLLFGYPEYAVDFFVKAGESQQQTGKFVERDFLSIPTVLGSTGRFVYAVPKGHVENDADRELQRQAAPIFEEYQQRRAHYIGVGKPGVGYLVRDWFDDGSGWCSTSREKVACPIHLGQSTCIPDQRGRRLPRNPLIVAPRFRR